MPLKFDWDPTKAKSNMRKHGASFEEAVSVFGDPRSITIPDTAHSDDSEERWTTIGRSVGDRILVVVASEDDDTIRIITARRATKHEINAYEEK